MALSILDGNQSATTLSTILSSGQHITAHTVISLGTQAIADIVNATSANLTNTQLRASAVTVGGTVTVGNSLTISSLPAISGTVTANVGTILAKRSDSGAITVGYLPLGDSAYSGQSGAVVVMGGADDGAVPAHLTSIYGLTFPISGTVTVGNTVTIAGTVTIGSALPAGTNRIGVVTIGAGTVTIGAGTAQIGSVTASISNFPATQPVSLTTLPALVAGTAQIGSVTASLLTSPTFSQAFADVFIERTSQFAEIQASIVLPLPAGTNQIGSVTANPSISSTAITSGRFTSLTSATLVPANTARKMATVYNLGAGQLFINAGVTATTLGGGFMVSLASGDFYECNYTTATLSAIFATAGTASWVSH
jgi:hypothetical protein